MTKQTDKPNKENPKAEEGKLVELTSNFKELANVQAQLSEAQMAFIKDTVAPSLTNQEIVLFLYRASIAKLDPLNGEMFAYATKATERNPRQLVMFAGRDGKRVAAERTGLVEYIEVKAIYVNDKNEMVEFWQGGKLVGAKAKGKRSDKDREYETSVPLSEYLQDKFIWKNKPETMIKKVAESQLLSMMFPNQLGGVYDADSENFIGTENNGKKAAPELPDGDKPATEEQKTTIKSLLRGRENEDQLLSEVDFDSLTKQRGAELISELMETKK